MTAADWSRIQALLHGAIEIQPAFRSAYLDEACPDPVLRAQVESFLGSYECIGSFLEPETPVQFESPGISWTGQMVGPYLVLEEIGRGGMGVVYKAEHTSLFRTVALKFIRGEEVGNAEALARFAREARSASALNHPNICTIYEMGEHQGQPFIAMEFLEGHPLNRLIQEARIGPALAASYGVQIADALAHAHKRGVIHRDLKTSNIMVTPEGRVKVLDFGLAKQLIPGPSSDELLTGHGTLLGTLAYMAPEVLRREVADARSDIWSLGLVLYEIVTGRLPFEGKTGFELSAAILREPVAALPASTPAQLRRVVARCLQKQPEGRYQSAVEIRADLERSRSRRVRALTLVALGSLVIAVAALGISFNPRWGEHLSFAQLSARLPEQRFVAVLPYANAVGTIEGQAFCDGMQETLTALLSELEPSHKDLRVVPVSEIRKQKLDNASGAGRAFGVNLILKGAVERQGNRIRITTDLIEVKSLQALGSRSLVIDSAKMTSFQKEAARSAASLLQLDWKPSDNEVVAAGGSSREGAYEHYLEGRGYLDRYDVPGNVDLSIQRFRSAIMEDPKYVLAYASLAEAYWRKHRETKDTSWLEQAQEVGRRAVEMDAGIALAHVTLGNVYADTGKTEEAIGEFRAALKVNPVAISAYRQLATVYQTTGRLKQAEATYLKAVQMRPSDWMTLTMLGLFYYTEGRITEAEVIFRRITQLVPDSYLAFANLGAAHFATGHDEDALQDYERSIAIQPNPQGYMGLGEIYLDQRKYAQAAAFNEKAVAMTGDNSYTALGNLAQSYQWNPALAWRAPATNERAIAVSNKAIAINPQDSFALSCRGLYEAQLGRYKRSISDLRQACALAPTDIRVALNAAVAYECLKDRPRALQVIDRALSQGLPISSIEHEPGLDDLQKDPEFKKLVTRDARVTHKEPSNVAQ